MATSIVAVEKAIGAVKIDEIRTKHHQIQVSNTKKPLFFYLNLAKRYIKQYNDVELSALGMAIPTVVLIAEILKSNGLATEKSISTSTVGSKDDSKGRPVQKAKIEIVLEKSEHFEKLMGTATKSSMTEKSDKPTTTAAKASMTEKSDKRTTTAAKESMTEKSDKRTTTAAKESMTEKSDKPTTTVAKVSMNEKSDKPTTTAAKASKEAAENKEE